MCGGKTNCNTVHGIKKQRPNFDQRYCLIHDDTRYFLVYGRKVELSGQCFCQMFIFQISLPKRYNKNS